MLADQKTGAAKPEESADQPPAVPSTCTRAHAAAVRKLFDDHNRSLVSFLRARLHDEAEARDVAQEAYVRLLELGNLDAIGFVRAYLFRIAANLAVDRLRDRGSRESALPSEFFEALSDDRGPERIAIAAEELEVVRKVLLELPENCRRAFVWHIFGGQSTVEIGVRLHRSDRMVRLYIAEALTMCRMRISSMALETGRRPQ
jgi:RNA polymerase sigma factor (sigma-70 family)